MRMLVITVALAALAGCASPVVPDSVRSNRAPEATRPSQAPPEVDFTCPAGPMMGPSPQPGGDVWCPPLEGAVEAAIARLALQPLTIAISPLGIPCLDPFQVHTAGCGWYGGAVAYVTFADSRNVAALDFVSPAGRPLLARLIAFKVPPAGWTIPAWSIP
jgi:hypothetical protein